MIPHFSIKTPGQIIFGAGKLAELEKSISQWGSRPVLVVGEHSLATSGQYQLVQKILKGFSSGIDTVHISSEPSPVVIDAIVGEFTSKSIDLVIAIGGGSTLDGGKAIAAMLVEQQEVSRFLEGVGDTRPSGRKVPFIAVPTTSGTGSEATSNAVLSSVGRDGFKCSLRHDNYIPNLALIDPVLTLSCPQQLTVACAMDCFTQLVEGYLSTKSTFVTDALAIEGIKSVRRSIRAVFHDGGNLNARTDLSYSALLSGLVLNNCGLGTVHGFASAIGGCFTIPHGVVCGTLMAAVNSLTLAKLRDMKTVDPGLAKYTTLGRIFSDHEGKTDAWYQDHFIEELNLLTAELGIARLSEFGVTAGDIETIIGRTANKNNPVSLSKDELAEIVSSRID